MMAEDIIDQLDLQPHPEGGYYRQTYRAFDIWAESSIPGRYDGPRVASTAIYFLLRDAEVSHLHRLKSDELWHHYDGAALIIHIIEPDGLYHAETLGNDIKAGMRPQLLVPHGSWFGAEVRDHDGFALVGNTVAPGFDFADFELADRHTLTARFPRLADVIARLTPYS